MAIVERENREKPANAFSRTFYATEVREAECNCCNYYCCVIIMLVIFCVAVAHDTTWAAITTHLNHPHP